MKGAGSMSVDADVQRDAGVAGGGPFDLDLPVRRRSLGGDLVGVHGSQTR